MHEVLVNRLGGLSLPRKSVVRLTDHPDMTLYVYRGRKTTMQQQQQSFPQRLEATYEIWLHLAQWFQEKSFESVDRLRTDDRGFKSYKLPWSLQLWGANKFMSRHYFCHSRASSSEVKYQIWPKFKLIKDFIDMLITCKFDQDWIINKQVIERITLFFVFKGM